ncbi:MAG: hypothetical protein Q4C56_08595 [Peptococcaceae bacterium]|nr:hypothetical protein [Peptococcaceae bacterium]
MAEKPKLHARYHYIDLYDDWSDFDYAEKENQMAQMDKYNFATANWSLDAAELEERTYEILHALTTLNDEDIARIMVRHENRIVSSQ